MWAVWYEWLNLPATGGSSLVPIDNSVLPLEDETSGSDNVVGRFKRLAVT